MFLLNPQRGVALKIRRSTLAVYGWLSDRINGSKTFGSASAEGFLFKRRKDVSQ